LDADDDTECVVGYDRGNMNQKVVASLKVVIDEQIWARWYDGRSDSTSTASTDDYWDMWNGGTDSTVSTATTSSCWGRWSIEVVERREQTEAEQEAEREQQRRFEEERKRRKAQECITEKKAEVLLLSYLNPADKKIFRRHRHIDVWSQSGRRFRIKEGRQHNIYELDDRGKALREYCIHVKDDVPNCDNVLAQKFMLECREADFLRIANSRAVPAALAG